MAFTVHWLKKKKSIEIVSDLCYEHRVRTKSYTHSFGSRNYESLQYHKQLLMES